MKKTFLTFLGFSLLIIVVLSTVFIVADKKRRAEKQQESIACELMLPEDAYGLYAYGL